MLLLFVSSLLKMGFVLVVIATYAPVLLWAERRQSAMIQDRIGPVRGGFPLPPRLAALIRGPVATGAFLVAAALAGVATLASIGSSCASFGIYLPFVAPNGAATEFPWMTARALDWVGVAALLLAGAHFVAGHFTRGAVDKNDVLTAYGLIHPLADVIKLFWKEDFVPPRADKILFHLAPIIAMMPVFAVGAVIPFGPDLYWGPEGDSFVNLFSVVTAADVEAGTRIVPLQVARINVGVLFMFAIAGTGIVGAALAGYSSDNKYSLLGGLRAASQMVSYEVTLGLTLVGCFMVYGTLLLDEMVTWQQEHVWGFLVQPLALVLFFFASIAEMKRVPFDAPEGESEIVAGYFLEYSGFKVGMFMGGEFMEHVTSSALIVTLFFGGYDVPFLEADGFHFGDTHIAMWHVAVVALGVVAFLVKVALSCFLQLQVRWTLPRFRYDQTMQLCWKIILPLSLLNIFVTGLVILLLQT